MTRPPPDTLSDELGGQSFDVGPNGPTPPTVQLVSGLLLHVPVSPQLHGGLAQLQVGHGTLVSVASVTIEFKGIVISAAPLCRL